MANWGLLGNYSYGIYTTPSLRLNANVNTLNGFVFTLDAITVTTKPNEIEYFYRSSSDNNTWTNWRRLNVDSFSPFIDNQYQYIQIKILLIALTPTNYPSLQQLKLTFIPVTNLKYNGDYSFKPKIRITKLNDNGDVSITNINTNQTMSFKNLNKNETVFIDCENEKIISDGEAYGIYRYDNHNDVFLELGLGDNPLVTSGLFKYEIEYSNVYLQE